jgi:autoinducer 2-degrading protein
MFVTLVHVHVKPEHLDAFVDATRANHEASVREDGNLRFDVLQSVDDPTRFLLYEAYRSQDDFAAHQKTAHYLAWKSTVADWMARPRDGVKHESLFFGDA